MPIDSIAGAQSLENVSNLNSTGTAEERVEKKALGQQEFFKLLTTQLASQDPLEPMEDTAFIAQMASFSELEMTSNLTKSFDNFTKSQQLNSAQGYIGKMVSFPGEAPGLVTSVEYVNDEPLLFLDGKNTDGRSVNSITKIEPAPGGEISSSNQLKSLVEEIVNQVKGQDG
ncbi:flagellar hook capping FlgD N-terminal domain-containing protein [Pelagicoccus mobilis]|uniref:Basal-body rod modification protein FlgD n=1 Tax=Pelagicoccus mobilis TaxID=415221 RepID=A0A934VM36_9BACT|nr:flagellar hook capping FlgD N-terminal domain-containing protein [Pelagicoccus mobilis]MBK1878436.1 hypothetical protein [Pelagicoccus mobilis]